MDPKYPQVKMKLVGKDGNAFSIMARAKQAAQRVGLDRYEIQEYIEEATSGDYNHLLATTMDYFTCDEDNEAEEFWEDDEEE